MNPGRKGSNGCFGYSRALRGIRVTADDRTLSYELTVRLPYGVATVMSIKYHVRIQSSRQARVKRCLLIEKIKISGYRKLRALTLNPKAKFNLIVGSNEAGKSTFLEAITIALTGRINGRPVSEELNPHWFNTSMVQDFLDCRRMGKRCAFPEIRIELFFRDNPELQRLCGANNSEKPVRSCPGVEMRIAPSDDYASELEAWAAKPSRLLPVEYYRCEWKSFAYDTLTTRPKQLATAVIDSRTVRASVGLDYHLRHILNDHLAPEERTSISIAYREVKASVSEKALGTINDRMKSIHASLHDQPITLAMDQSSRSSWEGVITPHVDDVPFSMSGQGQQSAIKISLAMNRHADQTKFVMVEEPENHLSHTSLITLLSRVAELAGEQQQLFVTTHSSFVLNRLGLDALILMNEGNAVKTEALNPETVGFFQKLSVQEKLI
jgi:putative ATP-dependent endonuclease of OLD family